MAKETHPITSIAEAKQYVLSRVAMLDPESRYIRELIEIIECSKNIEALHLALTHRSRPALQVGSSYLEMMTLEEKLDANLITPETYFRRFTDKELEVLNQEYIDRRYDC